MKFSCYGNFRMNVSSATGQLTIRTDHQFNGIKIFSATMMNDRDQLGAKLTAWLRDNPNKHVTDFVVTQSSDEAFHCIAITVFYWEDLGR